VYREVLGSLAASTAPYFGSFENPETFETWLFVKYLDSALRLNKTLDPSSVLLDAGIWSGRFHAECEQILDSGSISFLNEYTPEYYAGWANRAMCYTAAWHDRFPWVATLCHSFQRIAPLLSENLTIIHGEFYPINILVDDGVIKPVDWESAARAPGEIDLASLTEGWPDDIVRRCVQEYVRARWPAGEPVGFAERLLAARTYLHLRWLGDSPEFAEATFFLRHTNRKRFELLKLMAERLGILRCHTFALW
jgi:hypothetical protein